MIKMIFLAMATTTGFAFLFHVRGMDIVLAALAGGLGWLGFFVTNHFVEEVVFSHFVAALVIGMYAEIIALIRKVTPSVYIICAVIPLVPGYLVYETMSSAIHKQTQTMINKGLETLLIAGALSVGIAVSASLARLLFKRNKRIEAGE